MQYWLITEPARGLSFRVDIPRGTESDQALHDYVKRHHPEMITEWEATRDDEESNSSYGDNHDFHEWYADETGYTVKLIEDMTEPEPPPVRDGGRLTVTVVNIIERAERVLPELIELCKPGRLGKQDWKKVLSVRKAAKRLSECLAALDLPSLHDPLPGQRAKDYSQEGET